MIKNVYISLLLVIVAGACTKTEEAKTVHDTLRNGKWRQSSGTVRFQGQNGIDSTYNYFTDGVAACVKDDYIVFKENFSGVVEDADSSCGVGDPREIPFTWEVMKAETKLNIFNARRNFHTSSVYGEIVSVSESALSIRYVVYEQFTPGDIDTLTYTNDYTK